jgi:hypothetical protein
MSYMIGYVQHAPLNILFIYAEVNVNVQWTVLILHKEKLIVGMSCVNTEAIVVSYIYNHFTEVCAFTVFLE